MVVGRGCIMTSSREVMMHTICKVSLKSTTPGQFHKSQSFTNPLKKDTWSDKDDCSGTRTWALLLVGRRKDCAMLSWEAEKAGVGDKVGRQTRPECCPMDPGMHRRESGFVCLKPYT